MTNIEHKIDLYEFEINVEREVGSHRLLTVSTPGPDNLAGWLEENDPAWHAYYEAVDRNDGEEEGLDLKKPDWPTGLLAERDAAADRIDLMLALLYEWLRRELAKSAKEHGCAEDDQGCGAKVVMVESDWADKRSAGIRTYVPAETARLWAWRVGRRLTDFDAELSA